MDRLLLPEFLADVDRIAYIDIDTVVEGDVARAGRHRPRRHPLAARTVGALRCLHLAPGRRPAARRRRRPSCGAPCRARHAFDFATFNAGVLVLDLARMRGDRFVAELPPAGRRFGLDDQELLIAYAGADYAELDPRWHALPALERVARPRLVHYAGAGQALGGRPGPGRATGGTRHADAAGRTRRKGSGG